MKRKIFIFLGILTFNIIAQDKILVFGGRTGYIGQRIVNLINNNPEYNCIAISANSRLENREDLIKELEEIEPNFIINAAGKTGRPNVDWCEVNKEETIRSNVLGTLNLIDVAYLKGIHVTNFSTGCIYSYDDTHPMYSGKGFTEDEEPNFQGSFYSISKIITEKLLLEYSNVLNLRVKMPISYDLHPRSFIGKIIQYKKVINVPNSLCILEDLLPISIKMTLKKYKGNYNFVNPGAISHNEVLELYKKYVKPDFTYENFSIKEHDSILKAKRANCELDVSKLLKEFPEIPNIKESLVRLFKAYAKINKIYV